MFDPETKFKLEPRSQDPKPKCLRLQPNQSLVNIGSFLRFRARPCGHVVGASSFSPHAWAWLAPSHVVAWHGQTQRRVWLRLLLEESNAVGLGELCGQVLMFWIWNCKNHHYKRALAIIFAQRQNYFFIPFQKLAKVGQKIWKVSAFRLKIPF